VIRKVIDQILEVIYPTRAVCLGCGDEQGCEEPFLCEACRKRLKPSNVMAKREEWKKSGLEWAAFAYYYERPVKGLIRAYKFRHVRMLSETMAQELVNLVKCREVGYFDMIIPVPLHPSRQRDRGYNQAELLARPLAAICGELRTDVLKRSKKTKQQSKLRITKRESNLMDAFSAVENLEGKRILLVDDVVTTGSTLCSCAKTLKKAGAAQVCAVTLAGSRAWRRGRKRSCRLKRKK